MPTPYPDELVFVPLGGVGEIGMNMAAYGFGPRNARKWIVVDCGVTFAGPSQPGIELIMADPTFLEDNADDVLALVLTHSHEDHYGAVLDLWPAFDRPVYATDFTAAMLSAKRAADDIVDNVALRRMVVGQHHLVSAQYLHQYANHAAWLEDHRRDDNGTLVRRVAANAMGAPVSRQWAGYWQRAA